MKCPSGDTISISWRSIAVTLVALAAVAGCGSRGLHRVQGQVSFPDGSPVTAGRVVIEYGNGRMAVGRIRSDGSFRIGTLTESDGIQAGTFRVAIKDALVPKSDTSSEFLTIVHSRFADPATSGLEFKVPDQVVWKIVVEKP